MLEFERQMVHRMGKLGVPVFASEVWRDHARQTELYVKGNSRAKAGQSPHNYGLAVDIIHAVRGWDIDPKSWEILGHVGKELIAQKGLALQSFAWGGDWNFYDPAHWQVADWKNLKEKSPWPTQALR